MPILVVMLVVLVITEALLSVQLQIPQTAKEPTIPAKGYLVQEIRDQLYWVTDGSYNTMF